MQDDYGNAVRYPGTGEIAALAERVERVEANLAENTATTKRIEENTSDLIEVLAAAKGAFKTLEVLGKIARPIVWIGTVGSFVMYAWARFKSGIGNPFN